ncbi:MAG: cysteine peptidase family C39 domain-containing protein, partial [Lachnospiraceae bacterium]
MSKSKLKKPVCRGHVKVPVVMQLEALECGAASLAMVMAYYEKWIPLAQVRFDCGVSRDGSKASNILKAARSYGLKAQGYRYEPEGLREKGQFPCIIHWNFSHFVVLCGFKGNKVYINDPAQGTYTVSMEQFDKAFTGICMFFEPDDHFVRGGKPKSTWSFAKKRMVGTGVAVVFVVLTAAVSSLLGLINPAFARIFMDRLLTGQNPEWLYPFLLGLVLLTLVTLVVAWVQEVYLLKINGKLAIVANSSFLWHVLRMPMTFFSQRMAGDIAMRQSLNEGIANALISTFAPLVLQTGMMVFYLVAMLRYSVPLTVVGVISILANSVMARIISNKRINVTRVQMRDSGKLAGASVAGIEMIETIKASGAENGFFEKWAGYQASVNTQTVRFANVNHYLGLIPAVTSGLTTNAVLLFGVYLTMQGQFTVGMIMAFQGFLGNFTAPAQSLISAGQTLQEMRTNMERIDDVMEYPADVDYDDDFDENAAYSKLSGEVVMRDVTFGYSRLSAPVIEHFDLHLKPGNRVAFVGTSGCGKSTLSKLISGLYKPWSGEILFDGKPICEIHHSI